MNLPSSLARDGDTTQAEGAEHQDQVISGRRARIADAFGIISTAITALTLMASLEDIWLKLSGILFGIAVGIAIWRGVRDYSVGDLSRPMIFSLLAVATTTGLLIGLLGERAGSSDSESSSGAPRLESPGSISGDPSISSNGSPQGGATSSTGSAAFTGIEKPLADIDVAENEFTRGAKRISGIEYTDSLYSTPGNPLGLDRADVEFNLGKKYSRFAAMVGVSDESRSGTITVIKIYLDGKPLFEGTLKAGEGLAVDRKVSGGNKLHIWTYAPHPETRGEAVIGNARVA
ncbi:NPCBM/NEW2 domain-containing protein [Plantactinospora solaniradicis]|uniref:NPCBM/NEW2 domain-containing protein n=1 Tax=Plantactinospora solaniradicis TaxID=1723736 RepID=A0ABW1KJ20_9ACTN